MCLHFDLSRFIGTIVSSLAGRARAEPQPQTCDPAEVQWGKLRHVYTGYFEDNRGDLHRVEIRKCDRTGMVVRHHRKVSPALSHLAH